MIHLITVVAHSHYIFKFRLTESLQASSLSTRVINLSPLFPLRAIMIDNDIVCNDIVCLRENECVSVFTLVSCGYTMQRFIEAGEVYKNDCYETRDRVRVTFANTIAKQAMDTRIIIVNRAKMTLVVLAERRTNYFSTFSLLSCLFYENWKK